jgi:hypothetical protein
MLSLLPTGDTCSSSFRNPYAFVKGQYKIFVGYYQSAYPESRPTQEDLSEAGLDS